MTTHSDRHDLPEWNNPPLFYILEGEHVRPCRNMQERGDMFGRSRAIGQSTINSAGDGAPIAISTVFLGLMHGRTVEGAPLLFETMVFGGEFDGRTRRYATLQDARIGHDSMVSLVHAVERRKMEEMKEAQKESQKEEKSPMLATAQRKMKFRGKEGKKNAD